jgi:hypothetical protein
MHVSFRDRAATLKYGKSDFLRELQQGIFSLLARLISCKIRELSRSLD